MENETIKTLQMVRRIRDAQHQRLRGKNWEERVGYYQEQRRALDEKLKQRRDLGGGRDAKGDIK